MEDNVMHMELLLPYFWCFLCL